MTSPLNEILSDIRAHLAWQEEWGNSIDVPVGAEKVAAIATPAKLFPRPNAEERRVASEPIQRRPQAEPPSLQPQPTYSQGAKPQQSVEAPLVGQQVSANVRALLPVPASNSSESPARILRSVSDLPSLPPFSESDRQSLEAIRADLGDCQRCKLCSARKQIVFGVGNPNAELVFVGEGPGADEDAQGIPFVGAAGQLLTKMIEAMGFSRDDVYICNVVKCRPPSNRTPELDEIAACEPFLRAQLASLQPKVIVGLGKTAVQALLRSDVAITRIRGQWRDYRGVPLMPTFHPSYLLRQPAEKRNAWADLQEVMKRFGKEPKRS